MRSGSVAWRDGISLAALLSLTLAAAGPVWGPGLLNTREGGDSPFLLLRTHQLVTNLRAGVFPARWMPDAAYGFGYPFFSYYASLPYYLAAGFTLVGLDILSAVKLTQTLFLAAAALTMYSWARRALHSHVSGWLAAVAYTFAPFHLVNVYVRGDSLSEFAAFAFYPLVLWGLDRLTERPSFRSTLPPALAYAGLILTHNISALIFSPFVLLYLAVLTWRGPSRWRSVAGFGILAFGFGTLLSAWFWVPALAEIDDVQLTAHQTTGYFFYGDHFRGGDMVQRSPIFDYAISSEGPSPFAMGLAQAALGAAGVFVVVAVWLRSRYVGPRMGFGIRRLGFALLGLLLSTWLITPLSRPLWDRLPLLPMAQFPWRFLSVQALFTALLTGALIIPLYSLSSTMEWVLATLLGIVLAGTALAGLHPQYLPITAQEVTVERLQLYELFTGNIGSTIRYEYLPRQVIPRPYIGPALFDPQASPRAIPLEGELAGAERVSRGPTRRVWRVETVADGAEVMFPLHYWPGWRAKVDGAPVETKPSAGSGRLALSVPAGTHTVEIWLGRTPLRLGAEVASLAAALTLTALWIFERGQDTKERRGRRGDNLPFVICGLLFVTSLGLLIVFAPRVTAADGTDLTMDFENMPYLHHNPGGIDLDGWRMVAYRYSDARLVAGERLEVNLDWEARKDEGSATLRLVRPAAVRHGEIPALAETTAELDPQEGQGSPAVGSTTLELPIPRDAAPGLYLIQLTREASPIYLRPIWVTEGQAAVGERVRREFVDGALRLHALKATQPTSDQLDVRITWSAARPVAENYGVSLRLSDRTGDEWARLDTQPGYGFLPTSLWPADRLIHDRYLLSLPTGIPPGDEYTLSVILYHVTTWESVGRFSSTVSLHRVTRRPEAPILARFEDEVALSQLRAPKQVQPGDRLRATAYWLAVEPPTRDYVAEWRLDMPRKSITVTQPLAPGSSPGSWPSGAWVAGRFALTIPPTAPPGDYVLSVRLHDPGTGRTLGTYTHPGRIRVRARERVWELPPMEREVGGRFGGMIELAGYDLRREGERLRLRLHWQALEVPDRHYMLFVHLADPATGRPAAQVDTMPREFTYPTGVWAPGEVVSDEVVLSLKEVPAGRYELALGWYHPETEQRLRAVDSAGERWPDDRLILPDTITLH